MTSGANPNVPIQRLDSVNLTVTVDVYILFVVKCEAELMKYDIIKWHQVRTFAKKHMKTITEPGHF